MRHLFLAGAALLGVSIACTKVIEVTAGQPCPCTAGWTCCEGSNVCVQNASACGDASSAPPAPPAPVGALVTIANGEDVSDFVQDATRLFWENRDGTISGIAKSKIGVGPVVRSRVDPEAIGPYAGSLVVAGDFLYRFARHVAPPHSSSPEVIETLGLASASADLEIGTTSAFHGPISYDSRAFAVDETYFYVLDLDEMYSDRKDAPVPVPTDDGGITLPVDTWRAQVSSIVDRFLSDDQALYWLDENGVRKLVKNRAKPATMDDVLTLASVPTYADAFVGTAPLLADGQLYWLSSRNLSAVWTVPVAGGDARKIDIAGPDGGALAPGVFAVEGMTIFFESGNAVWSAPLAGGAATRLFDYRTEDDGNPTPLLVDTNNIYWAANGTVAARAR